MAKDMSIHSKKLYSYNINILSIKKTDHDCFDDKYYFYINIIDLKSEPKISFDIILSASFGSFCIFLVYIIFVSILDATITLNKK